MNSAFISLFNAASTTISVTAQVGRMAYKETARAVEHYKKEPRPNLKGVIVHPKVSVCAEQVVIFEAYDPIKDQTVPDFGNATVYTPPKMD